MWLKIKLVQNLFIYFFSQSDSKCFPHTSLQSCPVIGLDSESKSNPLEGKKKAQAQRKERKYLLIIWWRFDSFDAMAHSSSAPDDILYVKEVDPIHGWGEDSWMLLSRTNITRYFPLYFLKQTQGCRMFTYTVCYCQCSFSSRHRETNFLWNNSRDDTGFSEVSQLRHGKTRLYLFRA